jgi:hypothetical protein
MVSLEELRAKHVTNAAHAQKRVTSLQRDRPELLTPNNRNKGGVFSMTASTNRRRGDTSVMFSADGEHDSSPDVSPSRPFLSPNHPSNEVKALQHRLVHSQRQINTLKGKKGLKIGRRRRLDGTPVFSAEKGRRTCRNPVRRAVYHISLVSMRARKWEHPQLWSSFVQPTSSRCGRSWTQILCPRACTSIASSCLRPGVR